MTKWLYMGLTALFAIFVFLLGKAYVLEQQASSTNSIVDNPFEPSVSTPSPQVAGENIVLPPNTGSDPIVTCNFKYLAPKKMKSSECSKSFECQVGERWYIYTSREKCTSDQKAYLAGKYPNNTYTYGSSGSSIYPPCTLFSATLGYSTTYYVDTETCNKWKADNELANQRYYSSQSGQSSQPVPTKSPEQINQECINLANELAKASPIDCSQGTSCWEQAYRGCLGGGSPGTITIGEPEPAQSPNYEGTIVY